MKRIVLWCLSTVSVVVLLFGYHTSTGGGSTAGSPTSIVAGSAPQPASQPATKATKHHANGSSDARTTTVTGATASTEWGPVQVRLTMKGSTITKVEVLQYPHGNSNDAQINGYALPVLVQETLDAQSSNIDMVSGATVTSGGYLQSLQSALDQVSA